MGGGAGRRTSWGRCHTRSHPRHTSGASPTSPRACNTPHALSDQLRARAAVRPSAAQPHAALRAYRLASRASPSACCASRMRSRFTVMKSLGPWFTSILCDNTQAGAPRSGCAGRCRLARMRTGRPGAGRTGDSGSWRGTPGLDLSLRQAQGGAGEGFSAPRGNAAACCKQESPRTSTGGDTAEALRWRNGRACVCTGRRTLAAARESRRARSAHCRAPAAP